MVFVAHHNHRQDRHVSSASRAQRDVVRSHVPNLFKKDMPISKKMRNSVEKPRKLCKE